ncbi:MAG: copper amine oxidase N-terminal domain-containing protein [Bacillota bacterium]
MVILVSLPAEGKRDGPLYAGACENGRPVLTNWDPTLDAEFEPVCHSGALSLQLAGGSDRAAEPLTQPEDFAAWAFVRLNGQRLQNPYHDAYPYVTQSTGEPLVPLRLITEAMSGEVKWDEDARTVILTWRGRTATLTIGSDEVELEGEIIRLDQPPQLWLDRTMVSPKTIARLFQADVAFDTATRQVAIRRAGILCPQEYCIKA